MRFQELFADPIGSVGADPDDDQTAVGVGNTLVVPSICSTMGRMTGSPCTCELLPLPVLKVTWRGTFGSASAMAWADFMSSTTLAREVSGDSPWCSLHLTVGFVLAGSASWRRLDWSAASSEMIVTYSSSCWSHDASEARALRSHRRATTVPLFPVILGGFRRELL